MGADTWVNITNITHNIVCKLHYLVPWPSHCPVFDHWHAKINGGALTRKTCSLSWTKNGNISTSQNSSTWFNTARKGPKTTFSRRPPPSVYTHGINAPRPSFSISSYCKQSKTEWWKRPGNEATIMWLTNVVTIDVVTVLDLHGNIVLVQWGQWLQKWHPHLHDILHSICQV